MNRVLPTAGVILENPLLNRIALDVKADVVWILTIAHQLTVDLPLSVAPFKPERTRNARRVRCIGETVKLGDQRGVDAIVRDRWPVDDNFQNLLALARLQNVTR